jgi:hypothetical protein
MQGFLSSCIQQHIIAIFLNKNPTLREYLDMRYPIVFIIRMIKCNDTSIEHTFLNETNCLFISQPYVLAHVYVEANHRYNLVVPKNNFLATEYKRSKYKNKVFSKRLFGWCKNRKKEKPAFWRRNRGIWVYNTHGRFLPPPPLPMLLAKLCLRPIVQNMYRISTILQLHLLW